MKRINRLLAALAVAVLVVIISLLYWLRQRTLSELEWTVTSATGSFLPRETLHGPGGNTLVYFEQAERQAERVRENPWISKKGPLSVVVTKLTESGEEIPIVPFTLLAEKGGSWRQGLKQFRPVPLGDAEHPFGHLYLDLDLSALHSMNWAIGGVGLAIALMLFTLLARLWSQETSLTRTMVELNERRSELIRVERLALAGQLAASLLHDLRKPVLHIKHSLDDLRDALGDFAPAAVSLQDLNRQTRLFFQMLTESQIERFVQSDRAGEEYVDIIPLIDQSLSLVRYERRGVEVIHREADGLPAILAPPYRLIQLFSNLILNAYQAMDGRGRMTIEAAAKAGGVEVRVIDDGPGIPAATLDRIFDPFFTTKPEGEGTGLGLSICRMIADDLQGQITAQSRPGGPTAFTVFLPAKNANAREINLNIN